MPKSSRERRPTATASAPPAAEPATSTPSAPAPEATPLGAAIRRLRLRHRRTLDEIALACGCTKSLLSKVETGRVAPTVATLVKIAAALGTRVSTLIEGGQSVSTSADFAASDARRALTPTEAGYSFFAFAGERADKIMQPFLFVARRGEVRRRRLSHLGEEFIYVLEGEMRYRVGAVEYRLGPGDSLYFDSEREHDLEPLSEEVRYLGVFCDSPPEPPPKRAAKRRAGK